MFFKDFNLKYLFLFLPFLLFIFFIYKLIYSQIELPKVVEFETKKIIEIEDEKLKEYIYLNYRGECGEEELKSLDYFSLLSKFEEYFLNTISCNKDIGFKYENRIKEICDVKDKVIEKLEEVYKKMEENKHISLFKKEYDEIFYEEEEKKQLPPSSKKPKLGSNNNNDLNYND